jgi:MoxR-like ATPase
VIADTFDKVSQEVTKAVVGQEDAARLILTAMVMRGHVILEGVPGTAKTLLAKAIAAITDASFKRIQFTPDLMPSDITGTNVYNPARGDFTFVAGPVFTDVLLADEINRAVPKTQSALLEAMEERQVTIDGARRALSDRFLVVATQNPVEFEGTYPLPEAQLDRFSIKVTVGYPGEAHEAEVLRRHSAGFDAQNIDAIGLDKVITAPLLADLRREAFAVRVDESIIGYAGKLASASRRQDALTLGVSPRAAATLLVASKVAAAAEGRDFVIPDDIKRMAVPVLAHRLILQPEAEIEGLNASSVIDRIFAGIDVPR